MEESVSLVQASLLRVAGCEVCPESLGERGLLPQLESTVMPYLQVLSEFRHGVRKIAREKEGEAGGPVAVGVRPLCPGQPRPSLRPVLALADGRWGL